VTTPANVYFPHLFYLFCISPASETSHLDSARCRSRLRSIFSFISSYLTRALEPHLSYAFPHIFPCYLLSHPETSLLLVTFRLCLARLPFLRAVPLMLSPLPRTFSFFFSFFFFGFLLSFLISPAVPAVQACVRASLYTPTSLARPTRQLYSTDPCECTETTQ
jgi:hypothetical protein